LKLKYIFKGKLKPKNAVCAIIVYKNKILIQKRDIKKNIFFPGHYGLFGGAIEKNESKIKALQRELKEEIGLKFNKKDLSFLTSVVLDFKSIGYNKCTRTVYLINLNQNQVINLKLGEGKKMVWESGKKIYFKNNIIPYDAFAIWLYLFNK
jgi:8-oxo-dGTP pyrophosphatase MutT (NUDIX family)